MLVATWLVRLNLALMKMTPVTLLLLLITLATTLAIALVWRLICLKPML